MAVSHAGCRRSQKWLVIQKFGIMRRIIGLGDVDTPGDGAEA